MNLTRALVLLASLVAVAAFAQLPPPGMPQIPNPGAGGGSMGTGGGTLGTGGGTLGTGGGSMGTGGGTMGTGGGTLGTSHGVKTGAVR